MWKNIIFLLVGNYDVWIQILGWFFCGSIVSNEEDISVDLINLSCEMEFIWLSSNYLFSDYLISLTIETFADLKFSILAIWVWNYRKIMIKKLFSSISLLNSHWNRQIRVFSSKRIGGRRWNFQRFSNPKKIILVLPHQSTPLSHKCYTSKQSFQSNKKKIHFSLCFFLSSQHFLQYLTHELNSFS